MKNFKNYIFDLGGVIADINTKNALDGFRALGIPEEELRYDEGETARIMQNYQLGLLSTEEFCDSIIARCKGCAANPTSVSHGAVPTLQQVAEAWNSTILHIPQRKLDALCALKKQANVYLLSNTNELHWQKCLDLWFNANGNNIDHCFHHIFLSQEMHLEKPNPEIFNQAIREIIALQIRDESTPMLNSDNAVIDSTNTIFLDDNLDNVRAAISCGISAIQVPPDFDWVHEVL